MLRILVISLVVANLLLLAFQDSEPEPLPEREVTPVEESDSGIPTIHLFSEMMQDQGLLSGNRRCFSLGPFHSSEDRDETRTRLLEISSSISERETEALVEKGYWVFMPPYESLLIANEQLLSLQALGLEDIGIIYDGEWQSAISLGYFLRHENAVRRKKSLEERGYEPLIRVQRQAEPRYWLDYEQTPGSGLVTLDMQNRPNDFMQRVLPCLEGGVFDLVETDSQEPVEEIAQLQTLAEEDSASATEEPAEALPDQDGGIEQENTSSAGLESADDSGSEDTVETGQDTETGTEPEIESVPVTESEDNPEPDSDSETESGNTDEPVTEEDTAETEQDTELLTEPVTEGLDSAGPENTADTEVDPESENEPGSENAGDVESEDAIDNLPLQAVGTGPEFNIGAEPEKVSDPGLESANETDPDGTGEPGPEANDGSGTGEG